MSRPSTKSAAEIASILGTNGPKEQLNELSRLVDAELTVPSRLVRVALDEIDALKAEILEAHGQVNRFVKDTVWLCAEAVERNKKIELLEAEVARLRGAYRESREVLEELMDETEDTALQARIAVMLTYQDDALRAGKQCDHVWGIDGMHSNEYCKKCFTGKGGE